MLPFSLEDQILPGTFVKKRLDLSVFEVQYRNDEIGVAYALRRVVLCPAAGDC